MRKAYFKKAFLCLPILWLLCIQNAYSGWDTLYPGLKGNWYHAGEYMSGDYSYIKADTADAVCKMRNKDYKAVHNPVIGEWVYWGGVSVDYSGQWQGNYSCYNAKLYPNPYELPSYPTNVMQRIYCDEFISHGGTLCSPKAVCDCDEIFDAATNSCTPAAPLTQWRPGDDGVFYTHVDPNNDHPERCTFPAPEKDGLTKTCTKTNTQTPHPIDCATGQKKYIDIDYQGSGKDALSYSRIYATPILNTADDLADEPTEGDSDNTSAMPSELSHGQYWRSRDIPSLSTQTFDDGAIAKTFKLGSRIERIFFYAAGSSTYKTNPKMKQISLENIEGQDVVTLSDRERFVFNGQGLLVQHQNSQGEVRYFYHWFTQNGQALLQKIENRFGRSLTFTYNNANEVVTLTDQDGVEIHYHYDENGNLTKVVYPDATPDVLTDNPFKQYLFENPTFNNFITGIVDQEGTRVASIAYDEHGKAILSELTNGIDRAEVSYPTPSTAKVKFYRDTELNAYREEQYSFGQFQGRYQLTSKDITKCDECELTTERWEFNDKELLSRHTSPNGVITEWLYDAYNLLKQETTAVGTPYEKKKTYIWNRQYNKLHSITSPEGVTVFEYNSDGTLKKTTNYSAEQ